MFWEWLGSRLGKCWQHSNKELLSVHHNSDKLTETLVPQYRLAATTADMSVAGASASAFGQVGLLGGIGSAIGAVLASGVGPTELPQTVGAFFVHTYIFPPVRWLTTHRVPGGCIPFPCRSGGHGGSCRRVLRQW